MPILNKSQARIVRTLFNELCAGNVRKGVVMLGSDIEVAFKASKIVVIERLKAGHVECGETFQTLRQFDNVYGVPNDNE